MAGPITYYDDWGACRGGADCPRRHIGNDLIGRRLQPLLAATDGVVTHLVLDHPTAGWGLVITDAQGWDYRYYHVNNDTPGTDDGTTPPQWRLAPGITEGSVVTAGQVVAYLGDSGNSELSVPHLHFEIHQPDGSPIDPYRSLRAAEWLARCSVAAPGVQKESALMPPVDAGGVPAEGTSCLWNVRLMGGMGRVEGDPAMLQKATPFNVTSFHSGGTGARPKLDGLSATAFPSGVRNVPVEITETIAPVLVWSKEYRTNSGGAGEYRGGLGQVMEVESAEDMPFGISTSFDRVVYPPRGRAGGLAGMTGRVELASGKQLPPKAHSSIPVGERLRVSMPGGGGYGDPKKRPAAKVADDAARGLVSVEKARELYGVALTADFEVDEAKTAKLRPTMEAE